MKRVIRNTLAYESYHDIDMANAHPNFAAQLFNHLPIPTYLAYASDRQHFIEDFTSATGLGGSYCKQIVSSIMNGSYLFGIKDKDWKEMVSKPNVKQSMESNGISSLKDLNTRLRTVAFLSSLRDERDIIFQQIQHDYPAFYDMCSKKAKADKKNPGGTAYSLLMGDIENECLMVMLDELRELQVLSNEAVLAFDGMMVPKELVPEDDLPHLMTTLEKAVLKKVGFRITLVAKPMEDRLQVVIPDPAAMLRDTTKGGKPMLGRCIRRLSAPHEVIQKQMVDLAMQRNRKKKQLELLRAKGSKSGEEGADDAEEEMKGLREEIDQLSDQIAGFFGELFSVVGENTLKVAFTNGRGVVVGYDDYSISSLQNSNYAVIASDIKEWIRSGRAPCYRRSVFSFGGPMASDVFNEYCGLFVEQQYDFTDYEYDLGAVQPMLDHIKRAGSRQ